jgi:peptidoglycan/LPS O-acetylase OafA/YrhL
VPGRSREGADAEPGRFLALDSLRGIAAVGVALFHIQAVAGPSTLPVFRNGNLFVDFFFVLSGFVIAASYGERLAHGFGMARYMALRVGRVWPLHLFMVGAYLALELVSVAIGSFGLAPGAPFTGTHSLGHLFTGIFLLDGYIPERGNFYSGAGWSISVELLLYVLAALAFRRGRTGLALLFALGGIALAARIAGIDWPLFTRAVQRGLAGFAAGTACWLLHQHLRARRLPLPGLAEVAALASLFAFLWFAERHDYSALVVLPAALTVQVFAREEGALSRMLRGWGWGWLGRLSYAMYMVHAFVFSRVLEALILLGRKTGHTWAIYMMDGSVPIKRIVLPLVPSTLLQLAMIALALAASWLAWRWVEEPARQWSRARAATL